MKKFKIINIIAIMAILLASCSDDILEVSPSDRIEADKVFKTQESIEALRIGMYNLLGGTPTVYEPTLYQLLLPVMGDILGNDMVYGSTWYVAYNPEHQLKANADGSGVYDVWEKCYYLTEIANTIAVNEEKIAATIGTAAATKYVIEAKAIRAMVYYDCSKFYGKAYHLDDGASKSMPYVDYIDYEALPTASTMNEIYTKAIADIEAAIPHLPSITDIESRKWMNKNAAYAILSRIYLDMHNYEKARDYAVLAIDGVGFLTTEQYKLGLSHINEETILGFVLHEDNYYKWRSFTTFHDPYDGMGDDFLANYTLYDLIGDDDIRKKFFWHEWFYHEYYQDYEWSDIEAAYSGANWWFLANIKQPKGYYTYGKFPRMDVQYGASGKSGTLGLGHYSCIRSSEMYLTIAECEARLGNDAEAQNNLFMTVSRSIPDAEKSINTGQDLIDEILLERRKELFGEGHGYRDVLRLGKGLTRDGSQPLHEFIPAGDPRFEWPFPQREVNANPNLQK